MLIYICEKSENDALQLTHLLSTFSREKGLNLEVIPFSSGKELSADYRQALRQPDLLFLDGIDTAKELQSIGYAGTIIITAPPIESDADMVGMNYLHKPFDYSHFASIMEQCCLNGPKVPQHFSLIRKKKEISIPFTDILFFETGQPHTVILHTVSESIVFRGALSQIADFFHNVDNFLPVGRSFVINLDHVTGRLRNDLLMSDGSIVQIPLRKQEDVLQVVKHWQKAQPSQP